MTKIIRSICAFTDDPTGETVLELSRVQKKFEDRGYRIQTKRVCTHDMTPSELSERVLDPEVMKAVGRFDLKGVRKVLPDFLDGEGVSLSLDITDGVDMEHVDVLYEIIKKKPANTFSFTYGVNLPPSSPYFPSAYYDREGVSIGLQSTDLSMGVGSLEGWFEKMKSVWNEIMEIMSDEKDFLGIDSSIAPLFEGDSSLVDFLQRIGIGFEDAVLSDSFLQMTRFIKEENPMPIGLCGLMIPCLEDFGLAKKYEEGKFSIERNLFLSLHSGLGIDVYPIGIDEDPKKVLDIVKLVRGLSNKYQKPLAVRFVSDGKAKVGERAEFNNQYLRDVVVRGL
jgi:uncharacterized protein